MAIREFDGELDAAPQFREFDGKLDGEGGRTAKSIAGDVGVSLLKGAIGLPEAVVGLADIPTGGRVGRALESIGYRPAEAKKIADEWFSDEQKAANKAVQEADGFVGTLAESVKNPSTIAMTALESAPSMLGGAGIARGVMKVAPKIAPVIAGAVGEGAVTAGQTAAQIREESKDGLLTPKQSLSAVGAGAVTGILGFAGGKLAQKAGIADVDTLLASGQGQQVAKGFARQVVGSGISEGVFEELPQSMQEQMWQNYATGKPIMEGVGKAGATGLLAGMAMGAVGGAGNAAMPKKQQSADESAVPVADLYPEAEVSQPAQPEQAEVTPLDMGMQNRDRGTAASIMQMQSIANAPDFDRLGASPIPDVGAPLVSVKDNAEGAIAPEDMGAAGEVTLPDGSKVGFRYAVVDAGAVLASHGVDGRTNPAYADAQPGQIVALNNGRTAGLQEAYARGSASQQGGYMDRLISGAADFGLNPQAVAGKQNPVLVRVYDDKVNTRPDIAKQANSGGSMGMSAQEVARNDAAILPDLRNLVINDQGEFDPAANAPFVRGWVASLPQNEQAEVTDRAGNLSQTGFTRLRNAVIARAYGDNSVFGRLVESLDTDMRNVGKALVKAAPKIAQVRELIAAGAARDMDIGGQINQAVNDLVKLRQAGMSLADFLAQAHLFAEHKTAPEVLEILSFLDANLRAPNRIADFLAGYYAMVESLGSPKQDDMFGAPQVDRGELIRSAAASALPQNDLLGATDERNGTGVADRGGEETNGSTAAVAEGITGGEAAPAVPGPDLVGGDVRQESGSPEGGSADAGSNVAQPTVREIADADLQLDEPKTAIGKEARKLRERKEAKKAENQQQEQTPIQRDIAKMKEKKAGEFVKAPDGSFDFGEITATMAQSMRRQSGKIRLEAGNAEYGLKHIEERHGAQIRGLGFDSVADFVADAVKNIDTIWKPSKTTQLVVVQSTERGKAVFIELKPSELGDFYTVNTAFPVGDDYAERKKNWSLLWSGASVPTVASGANPLAVSPPDAGAATTMTPGQSSETTVAPENDNGNTADAGEELTYNKRNRRSGGLKWEDIKDKNAALRVKEVVKAKVYPKPDYQALVDGGMRDVVAHIVKQAYDAISPSPKLKRGSEPTDEVLRSYIEAVNRVMDGVMKWASDENAVGNWAAKQAKLSGASISVAELAASASLLDTVYPDGWRANRDELVMLGGNKLLGVLQPGYDEVSRALRDIKLGWPAKAEAWQKQGFKVVHVENLIVDLYASPAKQDRAAYVSGMFSAGKQRIDSFVVHGTDNKEETTVQEIIADRKRQLDGKYVLLDKAGRAHGVFESESAASEAAREKARKESGEKISEKGVSVEVAERSGIEHRLPGDNVTSERLMETFGFRGVNFGNWMKGDTKAKVAERQLHLNHLYDAFMDLAELLNLPPKAMSLNGMLGIAVGAQGSGKALAHFVPGVNEINVTRTKGAGALAHEWAHALDHYFAAVAGIERKADPFLTAHVGTTEGRAENGKYVRSPIDLGDLRPEVAAQFKAIVDAMSERKETKDEYEDRLKGEKGRAGRLVAEEIKKITNAIEKAKESWGTPELIAKIRGLSERIASLDYGDGRVSVADGEVPAVVAEIAEAYRDASGAPLANAYAIGYHADRYKVISDLLESSERWEPRTVSTDYQKASDTADAKKKKYWSSKFEMFARAFDAFVVDSLAEQDGKNTYLSGVEAVAPQGEERKAIGRAFDFLFSELKTRETERGIALFSRTISIPGTIHLDDLNAIAATFRKAYPGVPVVVLEKERQAPKSLRDKIKEAGAGGTVAGAFHEGSIYLIREGIRNIEHGQHVVVHEGVHAGLHKMFGDSISPILLDIWQNNLKIQLTAKKIKDKYGYSQVTSIEEALADMGPDVKKLKGFSRLVAWVRAKLRKLGWVKEWTDNDVEALVLRALSSIKNGGQTSIYKGTAFSENSPFDNMRRKLTGSDSKLTAALILLAESDALFQQPAAFGGTVQDVAREINPEYVVKPLGPSLAREKGADRAWEIGVPKSRFRTAFLYEKGNQVWLDLQHLLPGIDAGNVVYGIAAGYAHNTGKVLIGDPAGLSRLAFFRRTENMISSILKYGTSDHLEPHRAQIDPAGYYAETGHHEFGQMVRAIDWEPGNTAHNLKELIYTAYKGALHYMPELKDVYYDFDRRDFVRARPGTAGVPVPGDFFDELSQRVSTRKDSPYRAGGATQKRVALYNSMVRAAGDPVRWRRIVAEIGRQLHGASATGAERALDPALEKTFYSRFDQSETINVDGVERPALNSNGKPIAPTEEGLRNFWRWFGDSKVVDADGRPLVVYHGTAKDFTEFDLSRTGESTGNTGFYGAGAYFSQDGEDAGGYALWARRSEDDAANVIPVYLALQNPLYLHINPKDDARRDRGRVSLNRIVDQLVSEGYFGKNSDRNEAGSLYARLTSFLEKADFERFMGTLYNELKGGEAVSDLARRAGFDGVMAEGFKKGENFLAEVAAFSSTQIKSATGNNGDFDSGKSDIRFSRVDQNETAPTPQELAEAKVARILSKRRKSGPLETVTKAATKAIGIDRATAFAGGKVRQLLDALVPESWKAGIVADYGIPEAVTDRRDMMFGHMRRQLREAENTLVRLSTLTRQESRIAYEWMNNRNAEHLLDQLPEDSRKVLLELKRSIDDMGKEAVRLGQLEADTYERHAMAYLHRSYRKWELEANDSEKRTRAKAIKVLGDQYKGRGLTDLPAMSAIKNAAPDWWNRKTQQGKADKQLKGQKFIRFERRDNRGEGAGMLPGMEESGQLGKLREVNYWPAGEPVPAKYAAWHNAGTWEARDTKGDKVVMWRDFTPDERVKMGEIDEVRFAVAKTLHKMTHDLEVGKFFEWLAANQAKPEDKLPPEARVVDARESLTATFGKDDWVQVPDAKIPGTRVKRYGSLAGLYVPGPIWNDIRQIANVRHNPLGEHYAAILKGWKLSKTALSPAVHLNNIMSNFVMADWHDVTGRDVLDALTILVNQKKDEASRKIVEMFEDAGGTQGLYALSEIQREQISPLIDQLRKEVGMADTAGEVGIYAALQALVRFRFGDAIEMVSMTTTGRISAKALNKIIDIYSSEDTVFRLAAFMKAKREGASDIEAGRAARKSFLDYQINAPWIQMLRQTAFPFIAFTYRAVPMLLNTIEQKPWKLMKLSIFLGAANALGYALSGGDEDKERKLLPEEKAGGVLGGVAPKLIRMPWNYEMTDREGGQTVAPVFLDIRRFIPMGDIVDLGQTHSAVPILPMALPGGPLAVLAELIANKSQFTGRELTLETDTGMEKAGKVADHLYKAFAPNLIGLPWTYATESVLRAGSGRTDAFGREQSLSMAGLSSVGVKLGAYPGDVLRMNADLAFKRDEAEIKRGIRAKQREFSRNGMSEESFREALQRDIEKLKKRRQEYADKVQ